MTGVAGRLRYRSLFATFPVALSLSCGDGETIRTPDRLYRYQATLVTHVEQPVSAEDPAECGRQYITDDDTRGFLAVNRAELSVRLEGFGCKVALSEGEGSLLVASSQPCVVDGPVSFEGIGIERLEFERLSLNPDAETTEWQARVWRQLPDGPVSYCFELNGELSP